MDTYSLRKRLGEKQFDILSPEAYLTKLRVVADQSATAVDHNLAKEELLNAHLRLIAGTIRRILDSVRAKGGYTAQRSGVGIDEVSDLFNSMAGHVYDELTDMAVRATERGFQLSSAIVDRVAKRIFSKIRTSITQKNTAAFDLPDLLEQLAAAGEPFSVLESVILDEAYTELRSTAESLPGNQGLVFQAMIYGFETGQDLTIADIARALNIPETTARSAYHAARKILMERFPDLANGLSQ